MTPTLLLVDDDEGNLLTLSALLEDEGFVVHTAASVADAQTLLCAGHPWTVALLDQNLADGTGQALAPFVRARAPAAKIFLLTGAPESIPVISDIDGVLLKGLPLPELLMNLR